MTPNLICPNIKMFTVQMTILATIPRKKKNLKRLLMEISLN